jgi:ferredoxin-type protein NapH
MRHRETGRFIRGLLKDKTKRISYLRVLIQLLFLIVIFSLSIIGIWKGLLLCLIVGATFILGRFFCGWICPFGFYMDLVTWFRRLFKIRHWNIPDSLNNNLHKLRYLIALTIFILALPPFLIGTASFLDVGKFVGLRGPFTPYTFLLEPLETLIIHWVPPFSALLAIGGRSFGFPYVGEIMAYSGGTYFGLEISILFVILVLSMSFNVRRFWCRFCPTGISLAIVNRFKYFKWVPLLHLHKAEEKCTKCGICKRVCPLQVTEVYEMKGGAVKTSMCTLCLRCVEMCPSEDCLKVNVSGKTLLKSSSYLENAKLIEG